ncbi:MAG: tetratricopeptide repeat protein [Planctomycetota bacterium]
MRRSIAGVFLGVGILAATAAGADIWKDPAFQKLSKAIELFNAKELDGAEKLAGESLSLYPDNILAHFLVGEISLERERWGDAAKHFKRTTELYPKFAQGYTKAGIALAALKDYANAQAAFQQALSLAGEDTEALKGLALCTGELGKLGLAIEYYQQVLTKLGGKDIESLLALVNLYEKSGEVREAIRTLKFLISIEKTPERVKRLGVLYFNDKSYEDAIPLLEELAGGGHADADVLYCLGMSRYALGNKDGAIEALQKAIATEPSYLEAHYNLAVVYLEKKLVPHAIAELEKTVQIDPTFVKGYRTLGQIHEHYRYDIEEAKHWYALAKEAEAAAASRPASQPAQTQPAASQPSS